MDTTSSMLLNMGISVAVLPGMAGCATHGGDKYIRLDPAQSLQNLDFESGAASSGLPAGWSGGGSGYSIVLDGRSHGGKGAAQLRWTDNSKPTSADWCTLTQCMVPDDLRGRRVRFSGFARTESATSGAGLWMRVDQGKRTVQFDNMNDNPITGTTAWQRCAVVLDVPKDATRVCLGVLLMGPGAAWADDLKIEVVGQDVPVTDLLAKERTSAAAASYIPQP